MTKAELWALYCKQYPKFAGDPATTITFRVSGLRKMFDLTYDQAFAAGQAARNPFEDLFRQKK